jgi:type III restriction enzyme
VGRFDAALCEPDGDAADFLNGPAGVIYEDGDEAKIVRPDFLFFGKLPDGSVFADIVDPHGIQFGDAIPKLKGLARYAETL